MSKLFIYISIVYLTILAAIGLGQIYTRLDIWWMHLIGILTGIALGQIVAYIRSSTPDPPKNR